MNDICLFFSGRSIKINPRESLTIDDILSDSDKFLEERHDIIQWLFPLNEKSNYSDFAPVLVKEDISFLSKDGISKDNMRKCLDRFCQFYGVMEFFDDGKHRRWCVSRNHNLLRITRIIRSLRIFGLEDEAYEFYREVSTLGRTRGISDMTLDYWQRAVEDEVGNSLQEERK